MATAIGPPTSNGEGRRRVVGQWGGGPYIRRGIPRHHSGGARMPTQPCAFEGAHPPLRDAATSAIEVPLTGAPAGARFFHCPVRQAQSASHHNTRMEPPPGSLPRERKRIGERRDKQDSRETVTSSTPIAWPTRAQVLESGKDEIFSCCGLVAWTV
jgi:hypothetical protein